MERFFKWTAWAMQTPKSYGLFHLLFFFIGLVVAVGGAYLLRKTNDKQNRIILLVIGLFLLVFEIYKQLFYYYIVYDHHYPFWIFPFQLCSVPMYLCIICACIKSEKVNSWFYNFMFAFNLFGGAISFAEPSGLNHPYVMLTLHAYIWHLLLVFIGFYLFFSKRACTDWKGYLKALPIFLGCAIIAQILNVSLIKFDSVNMFFISPYVQSSIVVFHDFWKNLGWVANMFLFLLALILGAAIVYYFSFGCRILCQRIKQKRTDSVESKKDVKVKK